MYDNPRVISSNLFPQTFPNILGFRIEREREREKRGCRDRGGVLICFMSAPSSPRSAYQELTTLGVGQPSNAARPLFTPSQPQQQQQPSSRGNNTMGYPAASSSQQNFEDLRSLQGQADSMRDEAQVRSHSCSLPHPLHPFSALGFFLGTGRLTSFPLPSL